MRLSDEERDRALRDLAGWSLSDDKSAIARDFLAADFAEAFAFMTQIALAAEKADHHPDWSNSWNRVHISLTSHSEGGLTAKDVALAKRIDAIAARLALGGGAN